jgi:hypothetical protein
LFAPQSCYRRVRVAVTGGQGLAHSYQECIARLGPCPPTEEDPLGICHAQNDGYCSNHNHGGGGGGGVQLLEPIFTIEDRNDLVVITTEIDLSGLDADGQERVRELIAAGVEAERARHQKSLVRLRLLTAPDMKYNEPE